MPAHGRAILTFARSWYTVSAIRSLGGRGIDVLAGDEFALTPGSLSRYTSESFRYPNHVTDPDGFLDALEQAVRAHRPDEPDTPYVLMPMHREAFLIAQHRQRFEPLISMALPPAGDIERVRHKARLVDLARELDIAVPDTWQPADDRELDELAASLSYPAFVKVPAGAAGIGVEKVDDADALVANYRRLVDEHELEGSDRPIVQRAAPGHDYCTTAIFDHGTAHAPLTYRNVATFPTDGGPGAVRETVAAPRLEEVAARLLTSLSWHGIAQIDFRWTGEPDDEPLLLEVNPRFFGGLSHAIESGIDYPWYLFELASHGRVPAAPDPAMGHRTEAPVVGMLATLNEIVSSDQALSSLAEAWTEAKAALGGDRRMMSAVKRLLGALREVTAVEDRVEHVRRALAENRDNVSILMDSDDPLPALGLAYPLVAFLQRGSIDGDVLAGVD